MGLSFLFAMMVARVSFRLAVFIFHIGLKRLCKVFSSQRCCTNFGKSVLI